jgi:predicted homoserine dehydrogenase-like protein
MCKQTHDAQGQTVNSTPLSRRDFGHSLAAAAVTTGYSATARGFAANETITVGCIGTGGRCRRLMQSLATIPGVKITAVCDIWDFHLAEGKKLAQPDAFATKDYRAVLDRKDIDAVVIGTPRPLACADYDRCVCRGQGRLC